MKLLIDIGNTAVKFAYIDKKDLKYLDRFYLSELSIRKLDNILSKIKNIDEVIISSVVPSRNNFFNEYFLLNYDLIPQYIKVGDHAKIKISIDNPDELGVDLYCDLVGAHSLFEKSKKPIIIIDLGTASKLLLLEKNGEFKSCAIVPGIEMSKKMLSKSTDLLPEVNQLEIKDITKARNTNDVIASSVYYGHVEMINGLINRFEKEIGQKCLYVITGGNSTKISKDIKEPHSVNEYLGFIGMMEIINRG